VQIENNRQMMQAREDQLRNEFEAQRKALEVKAQNAAKLAQLALQGRTAIEVANINALAKTASAQIAADSAADQQVLAAEAQGAGYGVQDGG
jgi:hypothetical protein